MANTKCVFCDEPMRMGTKSLGVGMNVVTFFCDTCGAVTIHAHENFKRITEFDINFKTKPMTPKPHSTKMTYTRIDAAMESQMFPQELRSTIPSEHCPYEMDNSLENIDMGTYRFAEEVGDSANSGCRGMTCDECWAKEYNPTGENNDSLVYKRIKGLCKEKNISVNKLEEKLGFAKGSLCKIDINKPSADKINKLAKFFGVTSEFLVDGKNW